MQTRARRLKAPAAQYLEVDKDGGNQDPDALNEIPQHVNKGSPDTGVSQAQGVGWGPTPLLQRCILWTPRSMTVGGASLVQHKGHSGGGGERSASWPVLSLHSLLLQYPPPPIFPSQRENSIT